MTKIEPRLLSVQKAADFLGVNSRTIRRWALSKKLKGVKIGSGGDWRFTKENLLSMRDDRLGTQKRGKADIQTKVGKYTGRLSDSVAQGFHESFRLSDLFFRQIIDSLEDYAVFTMDKDGHISSWSSGAQTLFGYSEKEIIGKHLGIIFTPEDRKAKADIEEMRIASEHGRAKDEKWHVHKNGKLFWVAELLFPLKDKHGNLRGFTKIARNLTETKRRETNLSFLAEVSQDLVRLTNMNETMQVLCKKIGVHFSAAAIGFSEVNEATGIGIPLQVWSRGEVIIPTTIFRIADYHSKQVQQLMRSGKPEIVRDIASFPKAIADNMATLKIGAYVNTPLVRSDQWRLTLSIIDNKPRDWRKDELELMGELTARIWARIERAHAEEELRRATLQKDEFIGVAAHELKTPVTSVKAYAQVLEHRFRKGGDTASAEVVQKITVQVDKLTNLISELLDVTKIENGKLQLNRESFDINLLVEEIVEEMQRTTDKHILKLELKKNKSVFADRERLGQVFINLLSNAIKYSPYTKEILIKSMSKGQDVIVSVQDSGIGIPKEQQQKIFERFHRVPGQTKETYPGLGLGLYICSEIIKRHNGRIWVQSEGSKGSTFYVSVPESKKK